MKRLIICFFLLMPTLSACGSRRPTPILPPGGPISECFPSRTAQVWEDINGNGLFDEDERPLESIAVTMYPAGPTNRSFPTTTGKDGVAKLNGIGDFGPKCDELEVVVSVPHNYFPTTPTRVSLVGLPSDQILYFGLISQFPTPTAPPSILFVDPEKFTAEDEFFQACTLLTAEDFVSIFGMPLEYQLISSGGIGESGRLTYDCMTDPAESAGSMFYAFSVEKTASQSEIYFQQDASLLPDTAVPVDGLGDDVRFWTSEDGALLHVNILQGNVYLNLNISFWLEDTPENKDRLLDLARLILSRLSERGN